jgi:cell division septation protein DedD
MAVLVLAGCGEGTGVEHKAASTAAPAAQTPAVAAAPQWDVEVKGGTVQAVSDLTGWLIEHGFVSYVRADGGKERILIGPFSSKAEAEARQVQLTASLERAKKQNVESVVVEHNAAQ